MRVISNCLYVDFGIQPGRKNFHPYMNEPSKIENLNLNDDTIVSIKLPSWVDYERLFLAVSSDSFSKSIEIDRFLMAKRL